MLSHALYEDRMTLVLPCGVTWNLHCATWQLWVGKSTFAARGCESACPGVLLCRGVQATLIQHYHEEQTECFHSIPKVPQGALKHSRTGTLNHFHP